VLWPKQARRAWYSDDNWDTEWAKDNPLAGWIWLSTKHKQWLTPFSTRDKRRRNLCVWVKSSWETWNASSERKQLVKIYKTVRKSNNSTSGVWRLSYACSVERRIGLRMGWVFAQEVIRIKRAIGRTELSRPISNCHLSRLRWLSFSCSWHYRETLFMGWWRVIV